MMKSVQILTYIFFKLKIFSSPRGQAQSPLYTPLLLRTHYAAYEGRINELVNWGIGADSRVDLHVITRGLA